MIDFLKHIDIDILLFINGLHSSFLDVLLYWMTKFWFWIPFFGCVLAYTIKKYRKQTWIILLMCVISLIITDQSSGAIKNHVKRLRPSHTIELSEKLHLHTFSDGKIYRGGKYGFVSSHAANSFGIVVLLVFFLTPKTKHAWWIFPLWSITFCFTRMYLGVHYPSDIAAGAFLGIAVGTLLIYIYHLSFNYLQKKHKSSIHKIIHKKELFSTNSYLKEHLTSLDTDNNNELLPNFSVIYADFQSKGRGQQNHSWESKKEKNILMSMIFYSQVSASQQFLISKCVSLGICDFLINDIQLANVSIKWPNDIYVNHKKIAGILIENNIQGSKITHSIIGIGLNVNQKHFPDWIPNPTSIILEKHKTYPIKKSIKRITNHIQKRIQNEKDSIHQDYLSLLYKRNQFSDFFISSTQERKTLKILDVNQEGVLHVETKDETPLDFHFHEIQYIHK